MAGLAELLLGKSNPFAQFVNENQNKVHAAFGGLGSGTNFNEGLSAAAQAASRAAPLDQLAAQERDTRNKTAAYLRSQPGGAQFADAIENGMIDGSAAFKSWMDASRGEKPIEINGQLVDPKTMQVLGDFRTPETNNGPDLPASYREFLLAQENPDYAASLSSSSTKPPTEGERRNQQLATVIAPELATVETNWKALTDAGNQVAGSDVGGNRPGLAFTSPEYQQAINSLSTIVASYLYSVSGATATDEEIKRQVNLLTPKFGESEQSANAKLDRIRTYARAVTEAAGRAGNQPGADPLGIR